MSRVAMVRLDDARNSLAAASEAATNVLQEATLEDVESAGAAAWRWAQEARLAVRDHLRRPVVRGGVGLAVLIYGGHFRRTAVVCRSLKGYQLEMLQAHAEEVSQDYKRARGQPVDGEVADFVMVGRPLGDPRLLFASIMRLQATLIAQVAAALNENTSRVMMGLELGHRAAEAVGERLERLLLGPGQAGNEEQRIMLRMGIDAACSGLGVAMAWSLRGWAALWTTCELGAQFMLEAADVVLASDSLQEAVRGRQLPPELRALLCASLAGAGFTYQAWHGGAPPLPAHLWLLAAPLRVLELGLVSIS